MGHSMQPGFFTSGFKIFDCLCWDSCGSCRPGDHYKYQGGGLLYLTTVRFLSVWLGQLRQLQTR